MVRSFLPRPPIRPLLLLTLLVMLAPAVLWTDDGGAQSPLPAPVTPAEPAAGSGGPLPDIGAGNCPQGCVQISGGCSNCNPKTLTRCCTSSEGSEVNCPRCSISCGAGKDCALAMSTDVLSGLTGPAVDPGAPPFLAPQTCEPAADSQGADGTSRRVHN